MKLFLLILSFGLVARATTLPVSSVEADRAKELQEYIRKEKPRFAKREGQRKDLLDSLDKMNAEQNQVRDRLSEIQANQQELTMALGNLSIEFEKQKALVALEKKRLVLLLKVVYQIKKDGVLRFLAFGDNLGTFANRVRILYRTLRARSVLTNQFEERAHHLEQSEAKLLAAQADMHRVLLDLERQQALLGNLHSKKRELLATINEKQWSFHSALREYRKISKQVNSLFTNLESTRDSGMEVLPNRRSLPLPVESGHIVKNFGRTVHEKFGTVTFQKGIEIEADQDTPVTAILPGTVEFDGWVKGMGNVVILHHGGGFYTLSAHLHKALKSKGESVLQGDKIGLVGDTGNNDRPSLYFEIREKGKAVDPALYLSPDLMNSLL